MKKTWITLLVCLVSSFLLVSFSYAATGPYVSAQAGATWLMDADNKAAGEPAVESSFDVGYNVGIAGGFDFGLARAEAEVAYRQNDVDKLNVPGFGSVNASGDSSAFSLLVNGFWDIETGSPVTPYLGAGIGIAQVSLNDLEVAGSRIADDDDTVFAYQLAAGAAWEMTPVLALDLGYRFFATTDPEFKDVDGAKFDSEYMSHNVSLGLRFMF